MPVGLRGLKCLGLCSPAPDTWAREPTCSGSSGSWSPSFTVQSHSSNSFRKALSPWLCPGLVTPTPVFWHSTAVCGAPEKEIKSGLEPWRGEEKIIRKTVLALKCSLQEQGKRGSRIGRSAWVAFFLLAQSRVSSPAQSCQGWSERARADAGSWDGRGGVKSKEVEVVV